MFRCGLADLSSALDLELDDIFFFIVFSFSHISKLHRLHFARFIIEVLQLLLNGVIVLFIEVEVEKLGLFEFIKEVLVEGI